jgi:hypothetical protein
MGKAAFFFHRQTKNVAGEFQVPMLLFISPFTLIQINKRLLIRSRKQIKYSKAYIFYFAGLLALACCLCGLRA